jgi:hypothetical protein
MRTPRILAAAVLLGIVGSLLFAVWLSRVPALQRAGTLLDDAVVYPPDPMLSLPTLRDAAALERAQAALTPLADQTTNAAAQRMLGYAAAAAGDWYAAARALDAAAAAQPESRLGMWEAALAYEQMAQVIAAAPTEPLTPLFADAPISAPDHGIDTPYCQPGNNAACYVAATSFALPDLRLGPSAVITREVLFMHPPVEATTELRLPAAQPALSFLLGQDPFAGTWGTDGVTARIWVDGGTGPELAYERTLTAEDAAAGWQADWVDLSPWADRTVTLTLAIDGGPNGDISADWFGWGDLTLTTADAALYGMLAPEARMIAHRQAGGFTAEHMTIRAASELRAGEPEHALVWLERARQAGATDPAYELLVGQACQRVRAEPPLCTAWVAAAAGNRLVDVNFLADAWRTSDVADVEFTAPLICPELGDNLLCAAVTAQPVLERSAGYSQCLRLEAGARYTFSAWLQVADLPADGRWRALYIQGNRDGQPVGVGAEFRQGARDWQFYERTFTAPAYDNLACVYPLLFYDGGTGFIHAPSLVKLP